MLLIKSVKIKIDLSLTNSTTIVNVISFFFLDISDSDYKI